MPHKQVLLCFHLVYTVNMILCTGRLQGIWGVSCNVGAKKSGCVRTKEYPFPTHTVILEYFNIKE